MSKKKGKGKKVKKEKASKVSDVTAPSASLWEARLEAAEKLKQEYKENARKLLMENHALQTKMQQTEWETIDVINFMKKQNGDRESKMERLQNQVTELKVQQQEKIESLTFSFHQRINDLEDKLNAKTRESEVYHNELKLVQEFRKKRCKMEKEIKELKEVLEKNTDAHQKELAQCEKKFLEEKYQVQQESSQKIAELAEKAHQEAILNMDDTTKLVYKENIRLTEALKYHMEETEYLKKSKDNFVKDKENMTGMLKDQKMLLHKKVVENKKVKSLNSKLVMKIDILEKSLRHMIKEFENQKEVCTKEANQETEVCKSEIERLKQILDLKAKEMNKVKRLARSILEQRTELETFFIEAIKYVKHEIEKNRQNYVYEAKAAYQNKMLEAVLGRTEYPKIRTFNQLIHSTNDVHNDFEPAEFFDHIDTEIAISDLTWEQKERVLRYMFAKMNGYYNKTSAPQLAPQLNVNSKKILSLMDSKSKPAEPTFLTQTKYSQGSQLIFTV